MNRGKSHERRQCFHCDMTGYDWLCSAEIGSCDKSKKLFNSVNGKNLGYVFTSALSFLKTLLLFSTLEN